MTTAKMARIWDWMASRLADPPAAPKFKVSLWFLPLRAAGIYRNGVLICKPWASRTVVIHEACHYLWVEWSVRDTVPARAFRDLIGRGWWDEFARESWCATLTAVLVDRPGVWRQPISGAMPVKAAAWTFSPFLKEKP